MMLRCSTRRPGKSKKKKGGAKGKKGFGAVASAGYGSSGSRHAVPMARATDMGRAAGMGRASSMACPTRPVSACAPCSRLAGARCPVPRQHLMQGVMGKLRLV